MDLALNVRFPDKRVLTNELAKTQAYKDISQIYLESAKKAIELVAEFFAQKDCRSNCNFRSEVDEKLAESINSRVLVVRDNLEEVSIVEAVTRSLAIVALDLTKKAVVDHHISNFNNRLAELA